MLISETYREQQKALHEGGNYGLTGKIYAPLVANVINKMHDVDSVLDYGCGKALSLIKTISEQRLVHRKFDYFPYDPAVDKFSKPPEPADMVACIDVLEHIEPECLDNVLNDLQRLVKKVGLFTVSSVPAAKILPDGRNAHLIQQEAEWWLPRLIERFKLQSFQRTEQGFNVLVFPYREAE